MIELILYSILFLLVIAHLLMALRMYMAVHNNKHLPRDEKTPGKSKPWFFRPIIGHFTRKLPDPVHGSHEHFVFSDKAVGQYIQDYSRYDRIKTQNKSTVYSGVEFRIGLVA